jgi:hypothetical protein
VHARAGHALVDRGSPFDVVMAARMAAAFAGPLVVAHLLGHGAARAALMGVTGLIVGLVADGYGTGLPAAEAALLVVAGPAVVALHGLVAPASLAHVAVGAGLGGLAGWRSEVGDRFAPVLRALVLEVILFPGAATGVPAATAVLLGGLGTVALVLATDPVARRLRPPRPTPPVRSAHAAGHALRLGNTLAVAGVLAWVAARHWEVGEHAHWLVLGVWVMLRPDQGGTFDRAVQRTVGTLVGGLVTLAVAAALPAHLWTGWIVLGFVVACFAVRAANYAWYVALLTPVVVLGFDATTVDRTTLLSRVGFTLAGGVLALLARATAAPGEAAVGRSWNRIRNRRQRRCRPCS